MRIRHFLKKTKDFGYLLPLLLFGLTTTMAVAQNNAPAERQITGKVIDESGNPLIGVTVSVKNDTYKATITNFEGNYLISGAAGETLVYSFIGYVTQEVPVSQIGDNMTITMQPDMETLEDVVVVGYGVQKKVSVVGAISTVNMNDVTSLPAPSISQALVGKVPGLISRQNSGEPGKDAAMLYIRGMSTWGDNSPIVIVDGIERDLNTLNAPEIETITFLKDATATAVYGIRGANGVIIITTKKGVVGAPEITLRSEFAGLTAVRTPDFINSGQYAELWNEARMNDGLSPTYTPEEILRYYDGSDPYNYPSIDWIDEILDRKTFMTINNLSIRGGDGKDTLFRQFGIHHAGRTLQTRSPVRVQHRREDAPL